MKMLSIHSLIFASLAWFLSRMPATVAQSWKRYPFELEGNPILTFPKVEGAQYQYMGDSWFLTAEVQGQITGKKYQIFTIFNRNYISAVKLNFYQASIFDYQTGAFNTYTSYDLPGTSLVDQKFASSDDHLDVSFNAPEGKSFWNTSRTPAGALDPFVYDLHCPGKDVVTEESFSFSVHANMQKKPVAFGASVLRGFFTQFGQPNTLTYWQPGPSINGSLSFKGFSEPILGTRGHMDRQIFPLFPGILSPTGRQRSHEWRQVNLDNGIDLSIWRQFDRLANNSITDTTGVTVSFPPSEPNGEPPPPLWANGVPNDLTVEYISYSKYPRQNFSTLFPPPSQNMYMPSAHIIRSASLNMTLEATYTTPAPAAKLPIEYYEGPAIWKGTFMGKPVSATGIFESSLALYRDWELAGVLSDSVAHLPKAGFSAQAPQDYVVKIVQGLQSFVSSDRVNDHRVEASIYLDMRVVPALNTMTDQKQRENMLEIAADFRSSLTLVGEF
ncbi:hypothetical protein QQS21_003386 [Conoideocrella luteorostrata]|uniref:Uncharacterized protein n=1 Tax=Conoideocrella luteorostrata TaxID=1105319 RepID=A0AAJ0G0K1_9HYPO|nr:hypothetical protein QQS21_003386 [Conoideocrella luteorostrata]